jgi:probable FeS assembly SUF system protein SufT
MAGTSVRLMQALGGSYTVMTDIGYMVRVDAADAEALGLTPAASSADAPQEFSEKLVWDKLRTVYDPEIPVNVVDLGLIYACQIAPVPEGNKIDIKMTMTAPGCGMADVLKSDIQRKISDLPTVKELNVEVVFEPPWNPSRMSEAARLQLGLDVESSPFPMH